MSPKCQGIAVLPTVVHRNKAESGRRKGNHSYKDLRAVRGQRPFARTTAPPAGCGRHVHPFSEKAAVVAAITRLVKATACPSEACDSLDLAFPFWSRSTQTTSEV